ncbi:MAG: replicative DNA helicase [Bacteroidota bacterium]
MADSTKPVKSLPNYRGGKKKGNDLSSYVFGKIQPQALPLEEAVLGAIMLDKDALPVILDILQSESFYSDAHQLIYKAMLRLFERTQPVDLLTVTEELRKSGDLEKAGGPYYLVELTNRVASAANIEYHARIISQKHIQRELIRVSTNVIRDAYEDTTDVFDLLDQAEQGLFNITQQNLSRSYESMGSLASRALKQMEEMASKKEGLTGVPTGFTELDRLTSGWQSSDLIIVAARPGMGKTSFILALARNAAMDFDKAVAVFSLEMSNLQLVQRLISMEAEISGSKLRNGQLEDYEWQQLQSAIEKMSEVPIYIDDTPGINIFELRAKCRRLKMQHDIQMVVIDYLQLMSGGPDSGKGNREQEISMISRSLKGLAKELSVPVIALSQLSRAVETRGGTKRPQLSDLRECITGDTRILNADTGEYIEVEQLLGKEDFHVLAVDPSRQLQRNKVLDVWYTGEKEVYEVKTQSGFTIKASLNHPFYTADGWTQLVDLREGDYIGTAKRVDLDLAESSLSEEELIGLAREFATDAKKQLPSAVFASSKRQIALFLRHLWKQGALDYRQGSDSAISFASASVQQLQAVKSLLLRFGIASELRENKGDIVQLCIIEEDHILAFAKEIGGFGADANVLARLFNDLEKEQNVFLAGKNVSHAKGQSLQQQLPQSVEVLTAEQPDSRDIRWEKIVSIVHIGRRKTYDLHVEDNHNFVANDFVIHNSGAIEQDADIVTFIYRPEYYQILEDEEGNSLKGVGEIIVAKHRNGALKTVKLRFTDTFAKFSDLEDPNFNDLTDDVDTYGNQPNNIITRSSRMNDDDIPF